MGAKVSLPRSTTVRKRANPQQQPSLRLWDQQHKKTVLRVLSDGSDVLLTFHRQERGEIVGETRLIRLGRANRGRLVGLMSATGGVAAGISELGDKERRRVKLAVGADGDPRYCYVWTVDNGKNNAGIMLGTRQRARIVEYLTAAQSRTTGRVA